MTPADLEQLSGTYGPLNRVSWDQVSEYSTQFWDVLTQLSPAERMEMREALLAGAYPPALVASADDQGQSRAEGAALSLWTRFQPKTSSELAAWVAIMVSVLTYLDREPAPTPTPPPALVIVVQLPPENRPADLPPAEPRVPQD